MRYHNISYLINASIYLVKGGRLGLMSGVLFHSCRPSFRHTGVMFLDFAFVGETDPRTSMGPADRAPFGSAGGGDRTKSRSRQSTRAVYPASELSGEIILLPLLV